jgi:TPR repeat protein
VIDLGYDLSQGRLGTAHQYGQGVPKDINQAILWFRKAADQGDFVSQLTLGQIFEWGEDVEVNKETALCWYRKVAQNNSFLKAERQLSSGGVQAGASKMAESPLSAVPIQRSSVKTYGMSAEGPACVKTPSNDMIPR